MIWDEDVSVVVMLTTIMENGKVFHSFVRKLSIPDHYPYIFYLTWMI